MDTIQRVDQMVKKNIVKHMEQKHQQLYEKQIQQYQKQKKKQLLKSYAQTVKQGNKKAIQKMKQIKLAQQKNKKKKQNKNKTINIEQQIENIEGNGQNNKNKLNQKQIKRIQAAIQTRAQRIIQQKHLQKLDKQLAEEKKRTKLYQLNQRCRKIAKSSAKIIPPNMITHSAIPQDRRKILQQFQRKAMEQIQQLDNIIGGIIQGKNTHARPSTSQNNIKRNKSVPKVTNNLKKFENIQQMPKQQKQYEIQSTQTININNDIFDSPIFTKTTEELLSLQYIPI